MGVKKISRIEKDEEIDKPSMRIREVRPSAGSDGATTEERERERERERFSLFCNSTFWLGYKGCYHYAIQSKVATPTGVEILWTVEFRIFVPVLM